MFSPTRATKRIFQLRKRLRAVCGGTSASKTISILIWLINRAQIKPDAEFPVVLISVVSETMPHLRKGAMRDFINIMKAHGYWTDSSWNATNSTYTFETGSQIEFFSADSPDKVRGPRRDILFINEANNVPFDTFDQLAVRTNDVIWLDWNPTNEFWWYTEVAPNRSDYDFITLTYKDNEALQPNIIAEIESHKNNKMWWQVYGLGQLGETEGQIYQGWVVNLDNIPHEARLERYGLDFGYTNDPTAIISIWRYNGGLILHEEAFQNGLSNKQIADILNLLPKALVVADAAEPKSIDEIKSYGVHIIGSTKGAGSVLQGIQFVQDQQVSVTKTSTNLIKAYRNYMWRTDRDGKIINEPYPDHKFSDAMDAARYGIVSLKPVREPRVRRPKVHDPITGRLLS